MKKIIPILLLPFYYLSATAQTDSSVAVVRYTLTHIMDTTQPENPLKNNYVLYLGSNLSWYTYDRQEVKTDQVQVGSISGGTFRGNISATTVPMSSSFMDNFKFNNTFMRNRNQSQLIQFLMPAGSEKLFAVTEGFPEINWSIQTDTKTIMGLECQKATGRFKGRDYEAWFTTQLPYSNGPWKLGGLPGLIVEASDTKKEVVFSLRAIETDKPAAIIVPEGSVKTSPKEYAQYKEAMEKDRNAAKGASVGGTMVVSGIAVAGRGPDGKPVKPRQMNNPIEKEQ